MTGYEWVDRLEAYCFTVVRGAGVDEVIRRLGGEPSGGVDRTFEECFWNPDAPQWLQVGRVGDAVLVAEHNCWRSNEDDAVVALSAGGQATSFGRDVSAAMRFVYAIDRVLVTAFDPLLDSLPSEGSNPRALDRFLPGLPFGLHAAEPSAMELLERVTGVRLDPSWLDHPQRAVQLPALR